MKNKNYVTVLIAAAGMGNRMRSEVNKPYIFLKGRPVLAWTIEKFEKSSLIDEIIIIAQKNEIDYCIDEVVNKYNFSKVTKVIEGGKERQDSVYKGILALNEKTDIVLSHDGARPFVSIDLIEKTIKEIETKDGAILAVPVTDTIKQVKNSTNIVEETPIRSRLWAAQTPQTFKKDVLIKAYERAIEEGFLGTDDSSLVERIGGEVAIVEGSYSNIKLTTPEDLILAKSLIKE